MLPALPDDILGHVVSLCDIFVHFRLRLVCHKFLAGFVWKHTTAIFYHDKVAPEKEDEVMKALVPHLPALQRVVSFQWPFYCDSNAHTDVIAALAPRIKTARLDSNDEENITAFLSHCNQAIIEQLNLSYFDCANMIISSLQSLSRLESISICADTTDRICHVLDSLSTKTGSLISCTIYSSVFFADIGPQDAQAISASIRRLAAANPQLSHFNMDITTRGMFNDSTCLYAVDFFCGEKKKSYIPPQHWAALPQTLKATWGLQPTACKLHDRSMWENVIVNGLFFHLLENLDFMPDLVLLDELYRQLVVPDSGVMGLGRLGLLLCDPRLSSARCHEQLLSWAESRVIQRLDLERLWGFFCDSKLVVEALCVLGVRLVLPEQQNNPDETKRARARDLLAECLGSVRIPPLSIIELVPYSYHPKKSHLPDPVLCALLEYTNWCPPDTKLIQIAPESFAFQLLYFNLSKIKAILNHPRFIPDAVLPNRDLFVGAVLTRILRIWFTEEHLDEEVFDQLLRLGVQTGVVLTYRQPSNKVSTFICSNSSRIGLFTQLLDSPVAFLVDQIFSASGSSGSSNSQQDLVIGPLFETLQRGVSKEHLAELIWKQLISDAEFSRITDSVTLSRIIRPVLKLLGGPLPIFLKEFAFSKGAETLLGITLNTRVRTLLKKAIRLYFGAGS